MTSRALRSVLRMWTRRRNTEWAAARVARFKHERAVMRLGDPFRDRQPQTRARAAASGIELDEPIEYSFPFGGRDARAGVGHADPDGLAVRVDVDNDRASRWCVLDGVLHHVQHQLMEQIFVAAERNLGR